MSKETLIEKLRGYKSTPRHCEELCYEAANEIESLRQQLVTLKTEIKSIGEAIDDPRTDLTMTMSELILEYKQQLTATETRLEEKTAECLSFYNEAETVIKQRDEARQQLASQGEALAIQPDDSALKDKAMTTYEQPKDWIERHLVEDPGGLLACEPSRLDTLNEELRLARQANEALRQQLSTSQKQVEMLLGVIDKATHWAEHVMLRYSRQNKELLGILKHRDDIEALADTDDLKE